MHHLVENPHPPGRQDLDLLLEVSEAITRAVALDQVTGPVLQRIAARMGMLRGTITILNRATGAIVIEDAFGLSPHEMERGRYALGEGITGKVIATGEPAIVPDVVEEPLFLDRTRARRRSRTTESGKVSFICVPIINGKEVVGALSVDRLSHDQVSLDEDVRLLTIIASMLAQAVRMRQAAREQYEFLERENARLQSELAQRFRPANIIGNSAAMARVLAEIAQVAGSPTTALIRGESGVGKELVAQCIHYNSPRADKPFVRVNCGALPDGVVESELFGHERGAFTGAVARRKGRFELANGGTLFLDEIGDLPLTTQVKLLRVLQEKEFERLGGNEVLHVDVRIIAATHRDLEQLVQQGQFREDLFYRLNVFPLYVPPLRDRRTDVLQLADHFVVRFAKAANKPVRRISTPAIDMMVAYHWPGNVRELQNVIERAVLLSSDGVIHGHHLPPTLQTAEASHTPMRGKLRTTLDAVEREMIVEALKSARGNMAEAARKLGISERIMGLRVERFHVDLDKLRRVSGRIGTPP
jgi:Nif-specific regulatory protein